MYESKHITQIIIAFDKDKTIWYWALNDVYYFNTYRFFFRLFYNKGNMRTNE